MLEEEFAMRRRLLRDAMAWRSKPRAVRTTVGGVLLTCAVVLGLLDGHGQQRSASGAPTAQRDSPTAEAGAEGDVSEVLVCYSLGVYGTQSNPQATRVIA